MYSIYGQTGKNVWNLLKLKVSENQKYFVADNKISIIEAYQGKGYGKQTMHLLDNFINNFITWPSVHVTI